MSPTAARTVPPFALLVALTAASPFAMNAILPVFPEMQAAFHTSYAVIQLVLTLALVAFGASQLVLGPLSDRFGRRPVMLTGIALFVVGSMIAAAATSPAMLIFGRIVQAIGGAAGMVLGRTIAFDIYGRGGAAGAIGYLTMAMAVSQIVAPGIGGVLAYWLGWASIFWFLTLAGLPLWAFTYSHLAETNLPATAGSGPSRSLLRDGLELVALRAFWCNAGNMAFMSGMYFAFAGNAPHVVETLWGWSGSAYGLFNALPAIGYTAGNFAVGRMAARLGTRRLISLGMIVGGLSVALFWLLSGWQHPLALFLPVTLVALSNGMTLPGNIASAMSLSPRLAGSASGIAGALQMLTGAAMSFAVSTFAGTSQVPMLTAVSLSYLFALGFWALGYWGMSATAVMPEAGPQTGVTASSNADKVSA